MATVTSSPSIELDGLYEVIGSEIVEKPPMGAFEYEVASILQELIGPFVRSNRLGRVVTETLFDLRPAVDRSRRPDAAFVSASRWPLNRRAPRTNAWTVVPDLAIEVVSETNMMNDILTKISEYFRAGVQRVWVVNPDQENIYVYASPTSIRVLTTADDLDGEEVIPGFRLPVAVLFEGEPA